jgi:hypothetical protein
MNKPMGIIAGIVILVAAVLSLLAIRSRGGEGDGLSPEQTQNAAQLEQIAKKTGGDWNKLAPEERELIMKLSYGNERTARMLLMHAARTGPPTPQQPGGPPRRPVGRR